MVPNEMRAQISAVWMLCMNLISTIMGPTLVGFITVYVLTDDMAVGQSIAIVNILSAPLAALILWAGLKRFRLSQACPAWPGRHQALPSSGAWI